jgi:hypothetical protein
VTWITGERIPHRPWSTQRELVQDIQDAQLRVWPQAGSTSHSGVGSMKPGASRFTSDVCTELHLLTRHIPHRYMDRCFIWHRCSASGRARTFRIHRQGLTEPVIGSSRYRLLMLAFRRF